MAEEAFYQVDLNNPVSEQPLKLKVIFLEPFYFYHHNLTHRFTFKCVVSLRNKCPYNKVSLT